MDYKEKYEELEFLIKNLYPTMSDYQKEKVEGIFPEICQSEDEKIRQDIVKYIESQGASKRYDFNTWISWLEKQKKSEFIELNENDEKMIAYFEELLEFAYNEHPHGLGSRCIEGKIWLKSLEERCLPQPKQEWNEEDEERIEQICDDLRCCMKNFEAGRNIRGIHFTEIIESNIDWLKTLKPRWKPSKQNIQDLEWCASVIEDKMGAPFHRLQVFIDEIKNL